MKRERMLEELEAAADSLAIKVVYERLTKEASPGGLCRVNGEYRVIMDRRSPIQDRIGVLIGALARFPTEGIFLSPQLRNALERRAAELKADPESTEVPATEDNTGG